MALNQTNLSLEPLQCKLSLHLVLDPGVGTVLPLQQGGPAVPCLSVSLHQNDPDETFVLYAEKEANRSEMKVCFFCTLTLSLKM